MHKKIIYTLVGLALGLGLTVYGATALRGTQGGTGISTVVKGDLIYASGSFSPAAPGGGTLGRLAIGSSGAVLQVSSGIPAWSVDVLGARTASLSANLEVGGYASASFYLGSAFNFSGNCNTTKFLQWATTGFFGCGTPAGSSSGMSTGVGFNVTGGTFVHVTSISFDPGGFNVSNTASNGFVFIDYTNGPASRSIAQTITGLWDFNATPTSLRTKGNVGIGLNNTPVTTLEVWGTASASNFVSFGSVQFANAGATVSYSRFGTSATTHANFINAASDLLLSGSLDLVASANFRGFASISNVFHSDNTTNTIGIGTTASVSMLTIKKIANPGINFLNIASLSGQTVLMANSLGQIGIGTSAPAAVLGITGIKGQAVNALLFKAVSTTGTATMNINNNGTVLIDTLSALTAGSSINIQGNALANGANKYAVILSNSGTLSPTTGIGGLLQLGNSGNATQFAPTSGTNRFSSIENLELIAQQGTSQGTTRGFYENPNLTGTGLGAGAYDFRDFEIASHTYKLHGKTVAQGIPTTLQSVLFNPVTYSSSSANTVSKVMTLNVGYPVASSSVTITRASAIAVFKTNVSAASGVVASAYGLWIEPPSGATTNVGASISGRVFMPQLTNANTGDYVCFNTLNGEIEQNATACSLSSKRFKTDIQYIMVKDDSLSKVLALKPVQFKFKPGYSDGGATTHVGFIAEDAIKVDPRLVPLDKEGLPVSFDYMGYTSILTGAVQQLSDKVDRLEKGQPTQTTSPVDSARTHDWGLLGLLGLLGLIPSLRRNGKR